VSGAALKTSYRRSRRLLIPVLVIALGLIAVFAYSRTSPAHSDRPTTVNAVLQRYGEECRSLFEPNCRTADIVWPPPRVTLLAFKQERKLEAWAANATGRYRWIGTFDVLAASGGPGPKRRSGDMQVPEGIYKIDLLNPVSRFHVSMRVAYPNAEDLRRSQIPRNKMGGDIYIHGSNVSAGCLAMGDDAVEKLFCLVALARPADRTIIIAPVDFRRVHTYADPPNDPAITSLYQTLKTRLSAFR
jgi:hypothetical protein